MNTEFHYKGARREVDFTYSGRDSVFLSIFIALAVLILAIHSIRKSPNHLGAGWGRVVFDCGAQGPKAL